MFDQTILTVVGVACAGAGYIWTRSSLRLLRAARRIEVAVSVAGSGPEAGQLARSAFRKEAHTAGLYLALAVVCGAGVVSDHTALDLLSLLLLAPVALTLIHGSRFLAEARLTEERSFLERRAEEVLAQDEMAPQMWAARLAPADLPPITGFEVGRAYEPGSGLMAGDFYDVVPVAPTRLAVVMGDVSGHGIEPSITAFQVKYLLRVFLRQFRDPAQALEELNVVLGSQARPEEMVSVCVAVLDTDAGTLRYASAGHPPAWLWHDGEVVGLRSTGPLLTLDPKGTYVSREVGLDAGDVLVLYTDGLTEARDGEFQFGEDRVAQVLRRDPGQDAETLCKTLLDAARDFAAAPLTDDVAVLAVRRT